MLAVRDLYAPYTAREAMPSGHTGEREGRPLPRSSSRGRAVGGATVHRVTDHVPNELTPRQLPDHRRAEIRVLPLVASGVVGIVVGVLVARAFTNDLTPDEFNALGTWLVSFGTLSALLLAYIVHRRETAAREGDRTREQIREFNERKDREDRERAVSRLQEEDARLVSATVVVGSSSASPSNNPDTRGLSSLNATIMNRSTEPASDVVLRTRYSKRNWLVVGPTSRETDRLQVRQPVEIPRDKAEAREVVQEGLELRFTMHKRRWIWKPAEGVREEDSV